ncbi:MAG TPA: alpha/beta hydrolase, partial [Atopobiaceae bacterium]|nr:alpha/beta hydrolase [Atopobiaceae bacterium]
NAAPLILIHGSGPGVTAYANWNKIFPFLEKDYRVIAPDLVGFGYTERIEGQTFSMNVWVRQTLDLFDALGIEKANLIGNSFGGALALSVAIKAPERVNKLVLMGAMGVSFPITYGLDKVWGYTPSPANMERLLEIFTYDHTFATPELAESRYQGSIQPGFQESFSAMFPEPRQDGVEDMAGNQHYIRDIQHETLIIHGREDRVIPLENSYKLLQLIPNAELHVFGKCGHWSQIERSEEFAEQLKLFFAR